MSNYLRNTYQNVKKNLSNNSGQGLVEYALILVLIALAVIVSLTSLGSSVSSTFSSINSNLN